MRTVSLTSVSGMTRHQVQLAAPGTFFRRKDFSGSNRAIESALSRLASEGELIRVRRGLYWRGKKTRFGMTHPTPLDAALAVAGPGAGPSGIAAAHLLGLTTQVPATLEIAVPGKAPEPMIGIRFRSRSYSRRERRLTPTEIAVIEVLRNPLAAEAEIEQIIQKIKELINSKIIRPDVITTEIIDEPHLKARSRWMELAS